MAMDTCTSGITDMVTVLEVTAVPPEGVTVQLIAFRLAGVKV